MSDMMAVLQALMSADNTARAKAEVYFQGQLEANATGTVQQLMDLFCRQDGQTDDVVRSFAGVLLRRAIEKTTFAPEMNASLRGMLLQMWRVEQNPLLLKRLAHIMSQSAVSSSWLDLLPQIVENVSGLDQPLD